MSFGVFLRDILDQSVRKEIYMKLSMTLIYEYKFWKALSAFMESIIILWASLGTLFKIASLLKLFLKKL